MQIVVIGASGRTGNHILRQAVGMGYDVTAFVRHPNRLALSHERLRVMVGDAQDTYSVERALRYGDAVINVVSPQFDAAPKEHVRSLQHIIAAMHKKSIRRLITVHHSHVRLPNQRSGFGAQLSRILARPYSPKALKADQAAVEHIYASGLDWTMVLAHQLTDDPFNGQYHISTDYQRINARISRANLADFLLRIAFNGSHIQQIPLISDGHSPHNRPTIPLRR